MTQELAKLYPHLAEEVLPEMVKSDAERREYLESDFYIEDSGKQKLVDELSALVGRPDSRRPRGIIIMAESQMGKTTLLEQVEQRHPASDNADGERVDCPVLRIQYPETRDSHVWSDLSSGLNIAIPATAPITRHKAAVLSNLPKVGVKLIIIDEVANGLTPGKKKDVVQLNAIKVLMNHHKRPVVLGITPEVWPAINHDPQICNRFEVRVLKRYRGEHLKNFLEGWEKVLPLKKKSNLGAMRTVVETITGGLTGSIEALLKKAAGAAIGKDEMISEELLNSMKFITRVHVDGAANTLRTQAAPGTRTN